MTEDQKKIVEEIKANDQHPERGEIELAKDDLGFEYFQRISSSHLESWHQNG